MGDPKLVTADKAPHTPWGLIRPVDVIGMWAHRHMHEYGTKREHFGNVAIAARKHANKNPYAMMGKKTLDMPTYLAGRVIGYPLTLYDCCLETDGALACIVTTVERAWSSAASRRASPISSWWPRCTPSNTPMVTALPSGGRTHPSVPRITSTVEP